MQTLLIDHSQFNPDIRILFPNAGPESHIKNFS